MKLNHFHVAVQACDEIIRLTDLSAESFFRRSQARTYNLKSIYADLDIAEADIKIALEKKPGEKKYKNHLEILKKRKEEKLEEDKKFVTEMVQYAKRSLELKKQKEIAVNTTLLETPREIKIMRLVKKKYADCMEFFRDTDDNKQVLLTVNEFNKFSKTSYQKMMKYYKFNPSNLEPQLLEALSEETRELLKDENIVHEINNLKVKEALMLFGEGFINFELFKYATELIFKEEKKRKKALEKKQKDMAGLKDKNPSISYTKMAVYGFVVSILIYVLWNWGMHKFFWSNRDENMFGRKPGF
jgi:hypothetical protein